MFNPRTLPLAVIEGWEEVEDPATKLLDVFLEPEVHRSKPLPSSEPEGAVPPL
jgi:hypothetical protein